MSGIGPLHNVLPSLRSHGPSVDANEQVAADPLAKPGIDGWAPEKIKVVHSRSTGGPVGSALNATFGAVQEAPGQRLSTAQVDKLAPFFATEYGLDEALVRSELAKVYVYAGGPTVGDSAMTIGHHIFVPTADHVEQILSRGSQSWLVHELAHTMQNLSFYDGNEERFVADYIGGVAVGHDPESTGTHGGDPVWGSAFTGLQAAGKTVDGIGAPSTTMRERLVTGVLPAAAIATPAALLAGGALTATRAITGTPFLGTGSAGLLGLGTIAAPAVAGALAGSFQDKLSPKWSQVIGAGTGAALGGAAGAMLGGSGMGRALLGGIGLTLGAGIGLASAAVSANTSDGWSHSADVMHEHRGHGNYDPDAPRDYSLMVHDAHWMEIDAETAAQRYSAGDWDRPLPGAGPVAGRGASGNGGAIPAEGAPAEPALRDELDWGARMPLLLGAPAAFVAGSGILAARTGATVLSSAVTPGRSVGEAVRMLGTNRVVANSFGLGAALTAAPMIMGGVAGPLANKLFGSETAGRATSAAAGAAVGGVLVSQLVRGGGGGTAGMVAKVAAGALVAGTVGLLSGGVAIEATSQQEHRYDAPAS